MKKELLVGMMVIGWSGLQAGDNNMLQALRNNFSRVASFNVFHRPNSTSESRILDLEEISRRARLEIEREEKEIELQEAAFLAGPEANKARFALRVGLPEEIALQTIQRACASSPTLHATAGFITELDKIYYHETKRVKELQDAANDGSRTGAERADSRWELHALRKTPTFYENCHNSLPSTCSPSPVSSSLSSHGNNSPFSKK